MRRRGFLLLATAQAWPWLALAQPKVARIGILSVRSRSTPAQPDPYFDAFVRGMVELGYVEGKNLHIEWRHADGKYDRLPALAAELLKADVQVIVSHNSNGTQALQRLTKTMPIVMTSATDPVASGLVANLARPGGNTTGMSLRTEDVSPKHLELIQTVLPKATHVGVFMNPRLAVHPVVLKNVQAAAQARGMRVTPVEAQTVPELERGFEKLAAAGVHAVLLLSESVYTYQRRRIAELGLHYRLPTVYVAVEQVRAGGFMSYGADVADSYRRSATYVDRILRGAKPGDLPIEQASSYHLAFNRKTAKALGINIPADLLVRANEVID